MGAETIAYYNEIDEDAADCLEEMIALGAIAPGVVDRRSVEDVLPSELVRFTQCHFFAGFGGWSLALRAAGWPDDRPAWSGSCPCQPFSAAGKGNGFADERHLWPAWFWLVGECGPDAIFGEQVASKDGLSWLDLVSSDLEGAGYAVGALDTCAAGFGAPHIRQRLYWVADAGQERRRDAGRRLLHAGQPDDAGRCATHGLADADGRKPGHGDLQPSGQLGQQSEDGLVGGLGYAACERSERRQRRSPEARWNVRLAELGERNEAERLADADRSGRDGRSEDARREARAGTGLAERGGADDGREVGSLQGAEALDRPGPTNGFWRDADWLLCRDAKWRPVKPSLKPLVDGVPRSVQSRVRSAGLKMAGNGLCVPQATEFVKAYMDLASAPKEGTCP